MERHLKSSPHQDCKVATSPHRFNPMTHYNCCTTHTHKKTAKAPDEASDVRVRKETAQERRWRSIKHQMNENQTVADGRQHTDDTSPFRDTSRPGFSLAWATFPYSSRPDHAMPMPWSSTGRMAWMHGLASLAGRGRGPHTTARAAKHNVSRGEFGHRASVAGGFGQVGGLRRRALQKKGYARWGCVSPDTG
jgi:hypothetical protein